MTDGVVGQSLTNSASGNETMTTTFGTHQYQLRLDYIDRDGVSRQITSAISLVNIFDNNIVTATGRITPGATLTSSAASFNYVFTPNNNLITNRDIKVYNALTNDLIEVITLNNLSGVAQTTVTLLANTEYRADLAADIDGVNTIMSSTSVTTPPTNIQPGNIAVNMAVSSITANSVVISTQLIGNQADLAGITEATLNFSPTVNFEISDGQLAILKTGQNVNLAITGLTAATNYEAHFAVTGATINENSPVRVNFTTLNNSTTIQPTFNSSNFNQSARGQQEVSLN